MDEKAGLRWIVPGHCANIAFFNWTDSANWLHVFPYALASVALRICLRLALGVGGGIYRASAAFGDVQRSAHGRGGGHGL